jgi:uncharacterized protein YwgA
MLEKLIIYGSIAVALSIYPAIKLRKATALNRYQDRISVLEYKIDVIKITEEDPAKKFVKIDKIKAKIAKVKEKADKRMKVLNLDAKWEYKKDLLKLKRKQVYIDSTIVLDRK